MQCPAVLSNTFLAHRRGSESCAQPGCWWPRRRAKNALQLCEPTGNPAATFVVSVSFAFDFVTKALLDFVTGSVEANALFGLASPSGRGPELPLRFFETGICHWRLQRAGLYCGAGSQGIVRSVTVRSKCRTGGQQIAGACPPKMMPGRTGTQNRPEGTNRRPACRRALLERPV